jgi:hypothetical protein
MENSFPKQDFCVTYVHLPDTNLYFSKFGIWDLLFHTAIAGCQWKCFICLADAT